MNSQDSYNTSKLLKKLFNHKIINMDVYIVVIIVILIAGVCILFLCKKEDTTDTNNIPINSSSQEGNKPNNKILCSIENNASTSKIIFSDVLNQGKSTEAESAITNYAASILIWGNILSVIVFILGIIIIMVNAATTIQEEFGGMILILEILGIILICLIIRFLTKLNWASIMLFVNISTTLKRIEIKLEENNAHQTME